MAYGMLYKQVEITKKNGRLPSVEDAIKLAEERFWDDDAPNPCQCFHALDEARGALSKEKCELCPSQYYALGEGYRAYMYCLVEIGSGDGYGFAEWTYPTDDEEED